MRTATQRTHDTAASGEWGVEVCPAPPLDLLSSLTTQCGIVDDRSLEDERPPHRPCASPTRSGPGLRRVNIPAWQLAVPMWLRVACSGCRSIIVQNMVGVVEFRGGCNRGREMSFSAELVPCCRTRSLPGGGMEKAWWLLIYTDPSTGTWREEFFRRKVDAEAAQKALYVNWSR
jgi:hypothetical protein